LCEAIATALNAQGWFAMQTATHHCVEVSQAATRPAFISLDRETRSAVDTETAAYHLSREPQTLRVWACKENGPIRPLRVHGRLASPTAAIRALLGVA
jgi:hypothetical protein